MGTEISKRFLSYNSCWINSNFFLQLPWVVPHKSYRKEFWFFVLLIFKKTLNFFPCKVNGRFFPCKVNGRVFSLLLPGLLLELDQTWYKCLLGGPSQKLSIFFVKFNFIDFLWIFEIFKFTHWFIMENIKMAFIS